MKGHEVTQELLFSSGFYLLNLKPTQVLLTLLTNTKYMPYLLTKSCCIKCNFYFLNMNWGRAHIFFSFSPMRNSIQVLMWLNQIFDIDQKTYKEDYICRDCFKCLFYFYNTFTHFMFSEIYLLNKLKKNVTDWGGLCFNTADTTSVKVVIWFIWSIKWLMGNLERTFSFPDCNT